MKQIYIGVIGGSSCSSGIAEIAYTMGRYIAENRWILVCGGMGGVMEAACRGAVEAGGITCGILPGESREQANPYLSYSVVTGLGHARNLAVIRSSDAIVAIDGSYGTLSEISFANICGKPIVGLKSWRCDPAENSGQALFTKQAETAEEALAALKQYV
ncbi:MAG: TIGR00725 family protein [Spirochaetales bacterium]|nr:TIGR00725 family protein [Spirochaetales bacterium]